MEAVFGHNSICIQNHLVRVSVVKPEWRQRFPVDDVVVPQSEAQRMVWLIAERIQVRRLECIQKTGDWQNILNLSKGVLTIQFRWKIGVIRRLKQICPARC